MKSALFKSMTIFAVRVLLHACNAKLNAGKGAGQNSRRTSDTTSPTAPGTLSISSLTSSAVTLSWTKATDDVTTQENLEYEVRYSSAENLDSVSNAEANGTIAKSYTKNIESAVIENLTANTTYYFNVVVKDQAGNKAVYQQRSVTPSSSSDTTAPTAGTFSASTSVTSSGFVLNWSAASDNTSAAIDLQYLLCSGASASAIDSVTKCEAATVEMNYTANTLTKTISGKSESTTYYFNVVVKDAAGNKAIYAGKSQATSAPSGPIWAQEAYIKSANANAADQFGYAVGLCGDTVVVGAPIEASNQTTITNGATASADNSAANAGAAYIYKRAGATWTQEAYIKAANAEANEEFGHSVAINGDTVVVGAYGEDSNQTTITNGTTASANNASTAAGAAYVYKRSGTTWAQEAYLKAANAEAQDFFGFYVAISGDTIVVGASGEDSN